MPKSPRRPPKVWTYSPPRPPKPRAPDMLKATVQQRADALVESTLKPRSVLPPPADACFNYIVDIYGRWYRSSFYLIAKYACPGPNAISPSFESKFARLEYAGADRFHLAFMRYTGQWVDPYGAALTLEEALNTIRDDAFFQP